VLFFAQNERVKNSFLYKPIAIDFVNSLIKEIDPNVRMTAVNDYQVLSDGTQFQLAYSDDSNSFSIYFEYNAGECDIYFTKSKNNVDVFNFFCTCILAYYSNTIDIVSIYNLLKSSSYAYRKKTNMVLYKFFDTKYQSNLNRYITNIKNTLDIQLFINTNSYINDICKNTKLITNDIIFDTLNETNFIELVKNHLQTRLVDLHNNRNVIKSTAKIFDNFINLNIIAFYHYYCNVKPKNKESKNERFKRHLEFKTNQLKIDYLEKIKTSITRTEHIKSIDYNITLNGAHINVIHYRKN